MFNRRLNVDVLSGNPNRVEAKLGRRTIYTEANLPLDHSGTAWIPAVIPPAMKMRRTVVTDAPVDPVLLGNIGEAQNVLASWYPDMRTVEVQAPTKPSTSRTGRGIGTSFSGGVDSFYSATQPEVTHLVFVHGFDIDINNTRLAEKALTGARKAAHALGKELIEVRTNIRRFSDRRAHWAYRYHSAAIAHVAHLLADHLETLYIPSTYDAANLSPWGSHPDLDPWWSGSDVRIVHHSFETTRAQKVRKLIDNEVAMDNLRVCWLNWRNPDGDYNCGRCEKCIRTVLAIQAAGGSGRCRTLPASVPPEEIAKLKIDHHGSLAFIEQNIHALRTSGHSDPELEAAMLQAIDRYHQRHESGVAARLFRR